jgi:hypothetical protein
MCFFKSGGQEGKTGPVWGLASVVEGEDIRKGWRRVKVVEMFIYSCMKMEK